MKLGGKEAAQGSEAVQGLYQTHGTRTRVSLRIVGNLCGRLQKHSKNVRNQL